MSLATSADTSAHNRAVVFNKIAWLFSNASESVKPPVMYDITWLLRRRKKISFCNLLVGMNGSSFIRQ